MGDPVRDLPRVINLALSITITSFTLTVTAFYVVLPMSKVREKDTPAVVCRLYTTFFEFLLNTP